MNNRVGLLLITVMIGLLLPACISNDQGDEGQEEVFPYHFISDKFRHGGFDYPNEWDVTSVSSNVQLAYRDEENPENHEYSKTPYRYHFTFGRRADANEVPDDVLEEYNEVQAFNESTHRQHFYHSYYDHFADLKISSNGFLNMISEYDETEQWDVSGEVVLILRQENEWRANWRLNGAYYDLYIGNEAQIDSEAKFVELLELMIFH
ncbi:hypothetical protein [Salipaludibacillus daqingensis]|uniref:hypothetical protein n=1 Tax=Salipaludibacillus daqingensis TaxID=3041001 RepID=UPI0024739984|nr:hypothetical protein [Salipaludibacillus daqingensis]